MPSKHCCNLNFTYPAEDYQYLRNLLREWRMEFFYDTFVDELITVTVLKIIEEYNINQLMKKFPHVPIGIKALFIHKLKQWKINNPLSAYETITLNHNF